MLILKAIERYKTFKRPYYVSLYLKIKTTGNLHFNIRKPIDRAVCWYIYKKSIHPHRPRRT